MGDSGDASGAPASVATANPAPAGGKGEAVPAKDDDAPAAAVLPPVSSEEAANSTQESGEKAITQPPTTSNLLLFCLLVALFWKGGCRIFNKLPCS